MKRIVLFITLCAVVLACKKESVPVDNENTNDPDSISIVESLLPIGDWSVVSVDSGYIPNVPDAFFSELEKLNLTGSIRFNENNTGKLSGDAGIIACQVNDFTWVKNDSLNMVYFIFDNRLCKGIIEKMEEDSLVLQMSDWCRGGDMWTGSAIYYRLTAVK